MVCCMETLCRKEVINVCDGCRIGYVCDIEINTQTACVEALLVMPVGGFSFRRKEPLRVCWGCIQVIGNETVLVHCEQPPEKSNREKTRILASLFAK